MSNEERAATSPQSVTRVIRILEALCAGPGAMSLADLSRALDAPKSSLAALLRGLADEDFVVSTDGVWRLGPGAFGLGSALLEGRRRFQTSDMVREGMRRLAERSGETVLFAVPDEGGEMMTYVDAIESRNAVRFAVSIGDRRPLYATAGGRALLAAGSEGKLRLYLEGLTPEQLTEHTETSKARLAGEIATAREAGVAQTVDQMSEGVTGTAAAIHGASGNVVGALIVAAPSSRLQDRLPVLARLVREEAAVISRSLGYRPPL